MNRKTKIIKRKAALVSVLCLLFTAGILTALVVSLSKSGTFTVASHVELQRSMLISEGVANRVQWLLAADRNLNPDDECGKVDYSAFEYDRFMADGVIHTLDYYGESIQVQIFDAVNNWDMSQNSFQTVFQKYSSQDDAGEDGTDLCEQLTQRLGDYLDSDDNIQEYGMEAGDYEDLLQKPLPRNAAMQYREELLYIHDFSKLFPLDENGRLSLARLIPPANTTTLSGTPSLYSSDKKVIELSCSLEEDELENVMEALDKWKKEKVMLSETLDEELLSKLSALSTKESGAYTIHISAPEEEKRPFRKLIFSYAGFEVAGPTDKIVKYLEWNFL